MPKAPLVTRATTSGTNTENLNKASALTHAEMDKNLIGLRDSSWGLASDDSTVLQVSNDKTITIAGGTNITTALSGDTFTITGAAAPITALNNKTANRLTTIGSTTTELDGEANATFDGTTLAITGAITATTTIANDAITLDDNVIATSRSNDNLNISANGTGRIDVSSNGTYLSTDGDLYTNFWGATSRIKNFSAVYVNDNVNAHTTDREYNAAIHIGQKLTTGSSSNSNWRPRGLIIDATVDMNGVDYTRTGDSRGPTGILAAANAINKSSSAASQISSIKGMDANAAISDYNSPGQHITVDNAIAVKSLIAVEGNGSNNKVITNSYGNTAVVYVDENG